MPKLGLIIPAAGSGTRMGVSTPKPFIELSGKPILQHSIEAFLSVEGLSQVVIATSSDYMRHVQDMLSILPAHIRAEVVEGGVERQDSIVNALHVISDDIDLVAVHDAVRPFIRTEHIQRCADSAQKNGACIVAIPVKDTIKKVSENNKIMATPLRSELWQAQTPQIFQLRLLKEAYAFAEKHNHFGTDDASIIEFFGQEVHVVEGDRQNFKITYPLDLTLAQLLIGQS